MISQEMLSAAVEAFQDQMEAPGATVVEALRRALEAAEARRAPGGGNAAPAPREPLSTPALDKPEDQPGGALEQEWQVWAAEVLRGPLPTPAWPWPSQVGPPLPYTLKTSTPAPTEPPSCFRRSVEDGGEIATFGDLKLHRKRDRRKKNLAWVDASSNRLWPFAFIDQCQVPIVYWPKGGMLHAVAAPENTIFVYLTDEPETDDVIATALGAGGTTGTLNANGEWSWAPPA